MKTFMLSIVAGAGLLAASGAAACPDWRLTPTYGEYSLSAAQMRSPQGLQLVAGGDNYVWNCRNVTPQTDQGAGYFTSAPDARFFLNGLEGNRLRIRVQSDCDSALLINTGTATWYYDDDDAGNLDPMITLTRPVSGQIDVWVGTYDGEYCDAVLSLQVY